MASKIFHYFEAKIGLKPQACCLFGAAMVLLLLAAKPGSAETTHPTDAKKVAASIMPILANAMASKRFREIKPRW